MQCKGCGLYIEEGTICSDCKLEGCYIDENDNKYWYKNRKQHREGGPAVEYINGYKEWWLNNKLHREDGPAVEYINGYKEWWLNGIEYTEEEFNKK